MTKRCHSTLFFGLTILSSLMHTHAQAQTKLDCKAINCQCEALPAAALITACQNAQNQIHHTCLNIDLIESSTCSLFGKESTQNIKQWLKASTENIDNKTIQFFIIKWSTYYDLVINNFKRFDESKNQLTKIVVAQDLNHLQKTVESFLGQHTELAQAIEEAGQPQLAKQSWFQFAEFMQAMSQALQLSVEEISRKNNSDEVRNEILDTATKFYEHAGFGMDKAGEKPLAMEQWQKAAKLSGQLLEYAQQQNNESQADKFRFQQATQLHRARSFITTSNEPASENN